MGLSDQNNSIQLRILVTWICYLSFFRGVVSFFPGFVVNIISINLSLFLILIPPLVSLLPITDKSPYPLILMILCFLMGIMFHNIWIKLFLLMFGTSFTFLVMRTDFDYYSLDTLKWIPFIFGIDMLIRSPNMGQDLFVNSNLVSKILISFLFIILFQRIRDASNLVQANPSNQNMNLTQFKWTLTFFMIFVIYSVELAGPGILVMNNLFSHTTAQIINIVVFFTAGVLLGLNYHRLKIEIGVILGVLLGGSVYFYPWYNFTLLFWIVAIFALQSLLFLNIDQFERINPRERSVYILFSHYTVILVMFIGLTTESYYLIPILSIIVGILFIPGRSSKIQSILEMDFSIRDKYNKIIILFMILLLLTTFIPVNQQNERLEDNDDLVVMTYNIHFGISSNGEDNIKEVIDLIKKVNPTVIAFQEITFAASINGYKNMFSSLKLGLNPLGYKFSYFSEGGKYQTRNVVFSKLKIVTTETTILSPRVIYERNVIEVKIQSESQDILLYVSHLTHVEEKKSNPDRVKQAIDLMNIIDPLSKSTPLLLLGDFNAEPNWNEITVITNTLN
ncbi:MAG: endonuclease/exonuclease/phosphatase family protein, partial [Candidatus Kariarchaeaceae archaeon]